MSAGQSTLLGLAGAILVVVIPASDIVALAGSPIALGFSLIPGLALLAIATWQAGLRGGGPRHYPDEPKVEVFSRGILRALPWIVLTLVALGFVLFSAALVDVM